MIFTVVSLKLCNNNNQTWFSMQYFSPSPFCNGFEQLPGDLANVNAWKTMFDPYIVTHQSDCLLQRFSTPPWGPGKCKCMKNHVWSLYCDSSVGLPSAKVFNTSLGTRRMLMHEKLMFDPYSVIYQSHWLSIKHTKCSLTILNIGLT